MITETYEDAVTRTGRKWPYRTPDWPCPACGEASCDLDITMEEFGRIGNRIFVYAHKTAAVQ